MSQEKIILTEVLPQILDSLYEKRTSALPPPVLNIDKNGRKYVENPAQHRDTIMLYLYSTLIAPTEDLNAEIRTHFKLESDLQATTASLVNLPLDENVLINPSKFKFTDTYNLEDLQKNYGLITLSGICFHSSNKFATLNADFYCGPKCGRTFIIYLLDKEGKWTVDALESTKVY